MGLSLWTGLAFVKHSIAQVACCWKFFLVHYMQVLSQSRLCKAVHVYLTCLMLQWQLSHLNDRKLERRVFSVYGLTLPYAANTFIFTILYDFRLLGWPSRSQESASEILYDWRFIANQFVLATTPLRLTTKDLSFFNWALAAIVLM
jgi:hypothetical protein